ncbi:MAG: EutN/CcmL family microcompartment protein [Clostridiales bacterium]|nr:EutN/CcmL family microcompartment protein [Lachnospiraceae bacterium]MCD8046466.1 EutN/CcmL family microcompartment protein [Clostridiales bacterium]MCD8156807.1 EutN/CcmL family microcompartment protein [Clostridiales bacterium]MCD8323397.1 EutN/CcmL family microcompartment protein [Clostridiales bacterium]MCD8332661.1 EutN/CcmL family microcompartment protein [Clostridiales bacterium]
MQIGRVVGTVVSTSKSEKINGLKMLLVKPIDIETFEEKGNIVVAFDAVGAGEGEVVMIVSGSSSRQTALTDNKPSDTAIIAIIDYIDLHNKRIFSKEKDTREVSD